ncbi:hypothetical protein SDC9_124311 [bioreactor metagenome]|uniref:Uncharacterized protein n=1 Tax=bioreactor metagenome TaxID=1076179 RepID=A0A645CK79_9ZZZZ
MITAIAAVCIRCLNAIIIVLSRFSAKKSKSMLVASTVKFNDNTDFNVAK